MFSITIALGNAQWRLLFKTEESATKFFSLLNGGTESDVIEVLDDFGQRAVLRRGTIQGYLFEDMAQSKLAHIELMLHNAHTQAAATMRAQQEPALRAMRSGQAGPSVIMPMGNGQMR